MANQIESEDHNAFGWSRTKQAASEIAIIFIYNEQQQFKKYIILKFWAMDFQCGANCYVVLSKWKPKQKRNFRLNYPQFRG